jgi:hypothetical protein
MSDVGKFRVGSPKKKGELMKWMFILKKIWILTVGFCNPEILTNN